MDVNEVPACDYTDNPTGCCARFHPETWENLTLHFEDKPFARASTVSLFHVPLNMGAMFKRTLGAIEQAKALPKGYVVLSRDLSAWRAEHLFAVEREVPGVEMVKLSGDFVTKVFEGPFSSMRKWCDQMQQEVAGKGKKLAELYFFYTTCPRCSKVYGKNYVVGIARVE